MMMNQKNEPLKVDMPPMLYTDRNGQKWAVSGANWIAVPETMTLERVGEFMVWERPKAPVQADDMDTWQVSSSRNVGTTYTVTKNGDKWSCTCPGFGWRGKCRHILGVKNESR